MVEGSNGRISSDALDVDVHSYRVLEQLLRGFNQAYNALWLRVLGARMPNQGVTEHLTMKPELESSALHGHAGLCDAAKTRLIAQPSKKVSQPNKCSSMIECSCISRREHLENHLYVRHA